MSHTRFDLDLSFRPSSYFWPIAHETHVIAAIKGERRRNAIRNAIDSNTETPLDRYYSTPVLKQEDRIALGRLHPSFMGGEYLPNRNETEVEIARINIDSTTSDVTCVYAKTGKNRIYYRVVDEYSGDTLTDKKARTSLKPLTLADLIQFFLTAWPLQDVLEGNDLDLEGAQNFVHPSSEIYPQFGAAIRTKIDGWYANQEVEQDPEEDD
jgi:hypothetical protein